MASLEQDLVLVVAAREEPVPGVVALTLADPAGGVLPAWQPGAHVDVLVGEAGDARQLSLCGDPADRSLYRVAVLREELGRGGSVWIHDELHLGAQLAVRGPRNHFAFEIAPAYRFVAGGIGITAILPMVEAAAAAGARWTLDYGGRAVGEMAFAAQLRARHGDRVRLHESAGAGRMDARRVLADPDPVTDVYCCGPEPLMADVEAAAQAHGWLPGAVRLERFVAREAGAVLWPGPFEVDLLLSGLTVTVDPGETILDVVRDRGGVVLASCEEGTCGTCETPVLEGAVDHRDSVLTASEQAQGDRMMICVSRAACPRLVLEL